ncbi:3,4-dihydroxy-2-butanone-4-phosphate synthase [Helicobacter saguini]|uniref:3,4-dihydroxy-2-butanone 4-phosphate synthase n=1 Tax=Helicobacter saguini TaxID=1548018 RepID=A0A347VTI2_9HELI|nr:3,4-dihydroxy-2-butanone-4-phosphate synthase [Helicobacter saguini]MWV62086.1 3,4-dihydroxy-2-butanone-4-phosphate synthase [Helicobacter saguini]MWV67241.1 3,4-dihydroxy-2-butanone-4-phosphate synthase [Helicobacter saguini]MWV69594.1 3,4-dihydroxy-2-butanone-4-phosphate synthase [Helicobacter saguini]MWV70856.1 3,4-dihydroxy-2-butanone-4-phosphate synthase [Helicobacter saguini]TLD94310.1 3,4-dihydroxy-2-butanone-4-phosphate synthase [Helicobacter saguini]
MYKKRVEDAIEAIKKGEMIIIMDDEDRENEGDLVMAGIFSTPQKINFMAQEACGLICVCVTNEIARKLDLPPMVRHNSSNHETAFTISIDARDAKTGISAYERDMTIRLMCKENATPQDFVRPGHIFPLIAKEGGVLVRTGHTEAGVDICRLAGVLPIAVICEIMKKDGTMARRGDKFLLDFSKKYNLKILYVSDIIQYRLNYENLVSEISHQKVKFMGADSIKMEFKDHLGRIHTTFCFGDLDSNLATSTKGKKVIESKSSKDSKLVDSKQKGKKVIESKSDKSSPFVKFHAIRSDIDLLSNEKDYDALLRAVKKLQKDGGYLIFLQNDLLDSAKNMEHVKSFGVGAQILRLLNIKNFRLLSSNKNEYTALSGFNLKLVEKVKV